MVSAAKATGWAWKLPPEIAVSSSGKTIGLSVTAPASMVRVRAAFWQQVERGAHHLRLAAEAVRVLDPAAADVAGEDFAAVEQAGDGGGDADLAGLAAQFGDARIERLGATLQRIDRQRAGGDRGGEHALAAKQSVERERELACVPLISARPSLGPSCSGSMPSFAAPRRPA